MAAGLAQQHGLPPGALAVGLSVANDLDATADFESLCCGDAAGDSLLLRSHVSIRCARGGAPVCARHHRLHAPRVPAAAQALQAGAASVNACCRSHACRDLLGMLEDHLVDVCLEYNATLTS